MREVALGGKTPPEKICRSKSTNQSGERNEHRPDLCFSICRFSQVVFILRAQLHAQSLFLFPIVFGISLFHYFDEKKDGAAGNSIVCFAAAIRHLTDATKSATFLATESVNSAPFKKGVWKSAKLFANTKVHIFGKETTVRMRQKCEGQVCEGQECECDFSAIGQNSEMVQIVRSRSFFFFFFLKKLSQSLSFSLGCSHCVWPKRTLFLTWMRWKFCIHLKNCPLCFSDCPHELREPSTNSRFHNFWFLGAVQWILLLYWTVNVDDLTCEKSRNQFCFVFAKKRAHFSSHVWLRLRLRESAPPPPPSETPVFVWVRLSSRFHESETPYSKIQICLATVMKTQRFAFCFMQWERALTSLCSPCGSFRVNEIFFDRQFFPRVSVGPLLQGPRNEWPQSSTHVDSRHVDSRHADYTFRTHRAVDLHTHVSIGFALWHARSSQT